MFKLALVVLLLGLTGCSHCDETKTQSIFAPYYKIFELYTGKDPWCTKIDFDDTIPSSVVAGYCNTKTWAVGISPSHWSKFNSVKREQLISHELGHCVLHRAHREDLILLKQGAFPISLMNSIPFFDEEVFNEYRDRYYKELRTFDW